MRAKKIILVVLILMATTIFISCNVNNISAEPTPTQINSTEYDLKYMVDKELSQEKKEEFSEYVVLDILIASPIPLDELIGESYSIITAKLKSVEQDSTIKNLRYYEFETQENIKGNADNLSLIKLKNI